MSVSTQNIPSVPSRKSTREKYEDALSSGKFFRAGLIGLRLPYAEKVTAAVNAYDAALSHKDSELANQILDKFDPISTGQRLAIIALHKDPKAIMMTRLSTADRRFATVFLRRIKQAELRKDRPIPR
jgi:hypothetical protein